MHHASMMYSFILSLLAALSLFASVVLAAPHCSLTPPENLDTTPASSSANNDTEVVATGWYAAWLGKDLPPAQISWDKYSALTFAFATTTPDVNTIALDADSAALLPTFVQEAHKNGVQAHLSIGGWSGSIYYSSAVGSAANRTAFVKAVVGLAQKYSLDGIDFDWEYPGKQGIGCNGISTSDSANFLSFLQELKKDDTGSKLKLTSAVGIAPYVGMADVSPFAKVLDHIAIMNYDIWGSWSTGAGPNAPLDDSCAPQAEGSATSAVKAWTAAGFPASQIVLGVAAYGHSFFVANTAATDSTGELALYPAFDKAKQPAGDSDVGATYPTTDQCGNVISGPGGTFNFKAMITDGFLDTTGKAASGTTYRYDNCSQTPFVYQTSSQTLISYDDATSFAAKGKFINDKGLAGFAVWHIGGDSNNILLNAISDSMGIEQVCDDD
ncbi:glycoside hydrolase family 18 protein [Crepidotus variabilis]|uniref:Glycoside hydrolase family 18 protein n=1 Tax=Crepidotus variabilis TaxID=179855 RepID=A0A9P6EDL1_9AGAR|nr:glycoside hydrolase family 18 protein [Crepidotus variabilis]